MRYVFLVARPCFIFIVVLVQLENWCVRSSPAKLVCKTPECERLGTYYRQNMNQHGAPCTDFYDYVCRNWEKNHPRPIYRVYWALEILMQERVYGVLRNILEDKKISNNPLIEQAKALYKACLNMPSLGHYNSKDIKRFLPKVSEWPFFSDYEKSAHQNPWKIDLHYLKLTGESALFGIMVDTDEDELKFYTQLRELESPYGSLKRYLDWEQSLQTNQAFFHYKAFIISLIKSVAPDGVFISSEKLNRDLIKVIIFRESLRKIISNEYYDLHDDADVDADVDDDIDDNDDGNDDYNISIENLQIWYNSELNSVKSAKINFLEMIRAIYKGPIGHYSFDMNPRSGVNINKAYFIKLRSLLMKTEERIITNHIHLYFLERHLVYDDQMRENLKRSIAKRIGRSDIIRQEPERWMQCLRYNLMEVTLSRAYIKSNFPRERKDAVKKIIEEVKRIITKQILNSNWLDSKSKKVVEKKMNAVETKVGHANLYEINLPVSVDTSFSLSPIQVEAAYGLYENFLYISAAYLQWPIYNEKLPFAINYGTVASTIGHELYHAVDTDGIQFNHLGQKAQWWSNSSIEMFNEQAQSLRWIYSEYKEEELIRRDINPNITTADTFNEDFADIMGLRAAYTAFKEKMKENKGACPVLQGFEEFDCKKLFFIAFASGLCDGTKSFYREDILINAVHSLPLIRVNGAVKNMKEFTETFGCKSGDALKTKRSYDFWKRPIVTCL